MRRKLIEDFARLFETTDLLLTTGSDQTMLLLANLSGHPCVVVPNGGESSLTFIGRLYDEATILMVAKAYQDVTAFHTGKPPGFVQ